jgi:hypothetical protein
MIRSLNFGGNAAKQISFGGNTARSEPRQEPKERTDAVDLGRPSAPRHGDSFGLEKLRQTHGRAEVDERDPMTRTFEAALKALPLNEQGGISPESLFDFAGRATLDEALERYVVEGPGGEAEADLASAVDEIFAEYAGDLGLKESKLEKAKSFFMRDAESALVDEQTLYAEPWRSPDLLDFDRVITDLRDRIATRRQNVMESAGDLGRVLSELVVRGKSGTGEDVEKLGQFLLRFGEAVEAESARDFRHESAEAMMDVQRIAARSDAETYGRQFLSFIGVR